MTIARRLDTTGGVESQRVLAVGDVHGCLEELRELLAVAEYRPGRDRLVFLGDLIDRGPDPVGVVRFIRQELKVESVKGNHDEKAPRWHRHQANQKLTGKPNPMKRPDETRLAQWEALSEDDLLWIDSLPWTVQLAPGWLGVHAGFEPGLPLEAQKGDRMCRVRYVNEAGMMKPTNYAGHVPVGTVYWTTWSGAWKAPTGVVYGHAVHDTKLPRIDKHGDHAMFYGIDTGCCFGGVLTAWIHDGRVVQTVSVPAKGTYADLKLAGAE